MQKLTLAFMVFLMAFLAPHSGFSAATERTGDELKLTKYLEELFDASRKINAAGAEKGKARASIEAALDWDKVAELCLGTAKWKSQTEKNRTDFRNLLKEVIIKTAYTRLDKFWDNGTTYEFQKITVKGNEANVPTKFMVNGEAFTLEYFFSKRNGKWAIYDISYEDLRYSTNINEQLDAFLREKGFADLLNKLRKRIEDLNTGKIKKA